MSDLVPKPDLKFLQLLQKLDTKLPGHAATLEVPPAVLTQLHQDRIWFEFAVLQVGVFKDEYAERVAYKKLLRDGPIGSPHNGWPALDSISYPPNVPPAPGIEPRVRALIRRITVHPNYTDVIGADLDILTPEPTTPEVIKPPVRAEALPGCCSQITCLKNGYPAVLAESQRGASGWETLGVKLRATFRDERPPLVPGQPEVRQYRARYMDGDTPVGEWSDVVSVTLAP